MQGITDHRSLGDLFSELMQETRTLISQEIELARTEMTQKATQLAKDSAYLVAGIAVLYAGFLVILAMLVLVLALFMADWLAALIVGVVVLAVGYWLVNKGRTNLQQRSLAPRETIESLKEDREWMKDQVR